MKTIKRMNKKAFFTAFGAFLLLMLSGFAIGAYHVINWIVKLPHH